MKKKRPGSEETWPHRSEDPWRHLNELVDRLPREDGPVYTAALPPLEDPFVDWSPKRAKNRLELISKWRKAQELKKLSELEELAKQVREDPRRLGELSRIEKKQLRKMGVKTPKRATIGDHRPTEHASEEVDLHAPEDLSQVVDAPSEANSPARQGEVPTPIDVVKESLEILDVWASENLRLARKDFARFWAFKIPAVVCAATVPAFELLGLGRANIVLGVLAAICIGIDALFPGGRLHNAHRRAGNEIRRLQHDVLGKWRQAQLDKDADLFQSARTIIDYVQRERTRIDRYLTDAETSLGLEVR